MNDIQPTATPIPPFIHTRPASMPLGENPDDRIPVTSAYTAIEALLRRPRRVMYQLRQPGAGRLIGAMLLVSVVCSLVYGVVVGSFSGDTQLWAAPVKIAGGLMFAALICLPSLYLFACLGGSQARLVEVLGLLAGLLTLLTILLIGFAPVAWIFSTSTESLAWMGALHLVFWCVAVFFGLRFLQAGVAHTHARSMAGVHVWLILFLLVAVQMTTALRPILGTADTFLPGEKRFFVTHWAECLKKEEAKEGR